MDDAVARAAAAGIARDALWRDPPALAEGCEHDLELLPVIEARFTVVCRKCGGFDLEASRAIGSADPDAPEYLILPDSSVRRLRASGPDPVAAFCRARLDEDDAAARESFYEGQRWLTEDEGVYRWPDDELVHSADRKADARHIARHDPARVLREVKVLRSVVDDCEAKLAYPANGPLANLARRTLAGIASIWADRPDFDPAWNPVNAVH